MSVWWNEYLHYIGTYQPSAFLAHVGFLDIGPHRSTVFGKIEDIGWVYIGEFD